MAGQRRDDRGVGGDERGVSEVIAVVLMVAVTIVLAALVGTVILDIVAGVDRTPIAGAGVEFDAQNDSIGVTYQAAHDEAATTLEVRVYNGSGDEVATEGLTDVGDTVSISNGNITDSNRYRVVVVADGAEKKAVVTDVDGTL